MRALPVLLVTMLLILAVGCKKDNIDPNNPNNPNDTTGTNISYTQVNGAWEWVGKDYLHIPSKHGKVQNAWSLHGGIYCYWVENLGPQRVARVSYFDGSSWTNLYQDVNANAQTEFTVHDGALYQISSSATTVFTIQYNNGTATYIDTSYWATPNTFAAYLGSTGSDLIKVVGPYFGALSNLSFEQWNGTEWVTADSAVAVTPMAQRNINVINGTGKIYILTGQISSQKYELYSYNSTDGLASYAQRTYGSLGARPWLFEHQGQLYIMESEVNGTNSKFRTISTISQGGATTPVVDLDSSSKFLIEAFSTPQGIVYTLGFAPNRETTNLRDIMLLNNGTTKRFNVFVDEASQAEITRELVGIVGERGIYNGARFFYHNGKLHCIGDGHAGVFGNTGEPATKVYLARYNEE